jgi:hypothetical protein
MIDLEELRRLLKLPIDDFEFKDSNHFELRLMFRKQDIGEILNPKLVSSFKNGIIDTSRIKWGPIYYFYKEEIKSCLPIVDYNRIVSPLKYKSVVVRDKDGNHEEIYNLEYEHPSWIIVP